MNSFEFKSGQISSGSHDEISSTEQLCEIFLLYFDELRGHIPILICPDESIKNSPEKMTPIKIHSIWFLDIKILSDLNRIDLEYSGKMYFAKKFLVPSRRKKERAGLENDNQETMVLIIALPTELDIFGGDLLKKMEERLTKHFKYSISHLIESEIATLEIIKTPKAKELIKKGNNIKRRMKSLIKNTCSQYFQSVIKQTDATSLNLQKTISYLSLKGIPLSYIISEDKDIGFSNIKLFETQSLTNYAFKIEKNFKILNTNIDPKTQELEIIVKNQCKKDLMNLVAKIYYIKDFFEKELLNEQIEFWMSEEELSFILPTFTNITEYFLNILDGISGEKLYLKKVDLKLIM